MRCSFTGLAQEQGAASVSDSLSPGVCQSSPTFGTSPRQFSTFGMRLLGSPLGCWGGVSNLWHNGACFRARERICLCRPLRGLCKRNRTLYFPRPYGRGYNMSPLAEALYGNTCAWPAGYDRASGGSRGKISNSNHSIPGWISPS